jgi:hypothetical protein
MGIGGYRRWVASLGSRWAVGMGGCRCWLAFVPGLPSGFLQWREKAQMDLSVCRFGDNGRGKCTVDLVFDIYYG